MPSVLLGYISGGTNILSGNYWSGAGSWTGEGRPVGGVQIRVDRNCSGFIYVGLSGGVTVTSGTLFTSGGANSGFGNLDGIQLGNGDAMFVPKLAFPFFLSGSPGIWIQPDGNCSGQARVYWDGY